MRLEVTQKHICNGVRRSQTLGPLALALIDAGAPHPAVIGYEYTLNVQDAAITWLPMPTGMCDFQRWFDHGEHVLPTQFTIPDNSAFVRPDIIIEGVVECY